MRAEVKRVGDRKSFEQALDTEIFDLIISDYRLPSFNGLEALALARQKCPQTPFILVSGTIGEHAAIESLKAGATDYVLKQRPDRLPAAVRRAVQEAMERARLRDAELALRRREQYLRTLTENSLDILTVLSREGVIIYKSPSVEKVLGYEPKELIGQNVFNLVHPEDMERVMREFQMALAQPEKIAKVQYRYRHKDGSWRHFGGHWSKSAGRS
ncbi:MAG: PAS domain S-box protein [Limisphaerales bacterium]